MKKIFFSALVLFCTTTSFAQAVSCPAVSVTAAGETHKEGAAVEFTGSVTGSGSYTYNWSISNGVISSGQGTPVITVNTDGTAGSSITATIEIGGLNRDCPSTASATINVAKAAATDKPAKSKAKKQKTKRA